MGLSVRTRSRSSLLVVLALLTLVLSGLSALAVAPAAHAATGAVTGRVVDTDAEPISGATVSLYAVTLSDGAVQDLDYGSKVDTTTGVDGTFAFADVEDGPHTLQVGGLDLSERFLGGVFEQRFADHFVVAGDSVAVGDVEMRTGVTVTGTITDPDGQTLASTYVSAYTYVLGEGGSQYWYNPSRAWIYTAADGTYELKGVEPGATIVIGAQRTGLLPTYSGGVRDLTAGDSFAAGSGDVVEDQDVQFRQHGVVSGEVTD